MKPKDILLYNNCVFTYDQTNENLPENFKDFFLTAKNQHNYDTRGTTNKATIKIAINSTTYGLNLWSSIGQLHSGIKYQKN